MTDLERARSFAGTWPLPFLSSIGKTISSFSFAQLFQQKRVPVMLQMNATECGPACLAMVLNFYERRTTLEECRDHCRTGRDGASGQTLAQAASSYGLRVKAFSMEPAEIRHMRLPAILHWEFNHFVVLERWTRESVVIVDPAAGRRRLAMEEFEAGFTGIVLVMEPGVQFKTLRKNSHPVHYGYLLSLLQTPGTRGLMLQILAASTCLLALGLVLPLLIQIMVDRVLPLHLAALMPILGIGLALVVVSEGISSYLRESLLIYLRQRIDMHAMLGFFEHLLSLPFRFFQQRSSGDLLLRLGSNAILREALTGQTLSTILDGALVAGYLVVLVMRAPWFATLAIAVGVLQVALLLAPSRRLFHLTQRSLASQSATQSYLVEMLSGIAALKTAGAEEGALDHWLNLFSGELNASFRRDQFTAVIDSVMRALHALAPLLLLWTGALQVLHGQTSLGAMLALNAVAGAFFTPLTTLVLSAQRMQLAFAHLDRIADVLNAEPEQGTSFHTRTHALEGRIELRNVSFRYDENGPFVLRNISLTIEPGQKIAIAGPSGSGKSTLAAILLGLYPPTEGEIFYDGIPLQQLNFRDLRQQIGVVLQDSFLHSGSIRKNIALGNSSLDMDQIIAAAKMAAIHEDIVRMPMGYETGLAEGGAGISGGQRQRISLARALARQPAILLLDEATSHLDGITESVVAHNLEKLSSTRIVIAHRLNTIRNADQILVLESGTIVEHGTHEQLFRNPGYYAGLIVNQVERHDMATFEAASIRR
jgi:ABC-type bacteriocin/lantibiotic exporter with double-glycine peptidase domain